MSGYRGLGPPLQIHHVQHREGSPQLVHCDQMLDIFLLVAYNLGFSVFGWGKGYRNDIAHGKKLQTDAVLWRYRNVDGSYSGYIGNSCIGYLF